MKTFHPRNPVASHSHRMDLRRQSRCSLALIMLMGLATLSVVATTQTTLSADDAAPVHFYAIQ